MIGFIFGTRPEVTKSIGIMKSYSRISSGAVCAIATGQQTSLVRSAFTDLRASDHSQIEWLANCNAHGQDEMWEANFERSLESLTSRRGIRTLVGTGDTLSVLRAAQFCRRNELRFVHLEAGVRHHCATHDPEPEEINRREISKISDLHCCPTLLQRTSLLSEGYDEDSIVIIGDLSVLAISEAWHARVEQANNIEAALSNLELKSNGRLCTCTFHRSTSLKQNASLIDQMLACIRNFPSFTFLVCRRPDSRWDQFHSQLSSMPNVRVIEAPGPLLFQALLCKSEFVVTDSAGVQQEALLLNRPVVAMRSNIELMADHPLLRVVRPPYGTLSSSVVELLEVSVAFSQRDIENCCVQGSHISTMAASVIERFSL
jgi:UDP-N-acetylglucosamine 2-epimerase (non-hydrolysing)